MDFLEDGFTETKIPEKRKTKKRNRNRNHWKGTPFSTSRMASYYTTLFYYTLMVSSGWLLFKAFFNNHKEQCVQKSPLFEG